MTAMKKIELIPIRDIRVLNPRERNQKKFKQIAENIANVGLKKPITVAKRTNVKNGEAKYDVLQIGIDVDREIIYERIDERVEKMIAEGLVNEVRELRDTYGCETKSMTGIGYRQICAFLDGYIKLHDAIDLVKRETRHYAKRQITWFKRDDRIVWVKNFLEAMKTIQTFL